MDIYRIAAAAFLAGLLFGYWRDLSRTHRVMAFAWIAVLLLSVNYANLARPMVIKHVTVTVVERTPTT